MVRLKTFQELFRRNRRPGDFVFSLAFLLFVTFLLLNLGEQAKWISGTKMAAQPAFWPTVSLIGMGIFATLHLVGAMVSPRALGRAGEVGFWVRSLEYVFYFLIYVLLVPKIGYLPATLVFSAFVTFRLGYRRPQAFMASIAFSLAVVLFFRAFLQVRIPAGQIYEHLPDAIRSFAMIYL